MFDACSGGAADADEPDTDLPPEPWNRPCSAVRPNGYAALELQDATLDPAGLSDADVVEAIRAFDHVASWAGAQQARMLAEFARRRPPDRTDPIDRPTPGPVSTWAPDEIGLALTLSRGTAADRIERSVRLTHVLPDTLSAWDAGLLDAAKVNAIHDATLCLSDAAARVVQDRVLPKAPTQTVAQLRAALERAVIAVDPAGADARHRKAHRSRRVSLHADRDGMAALWAFMSAPNALACYGWLTALARGLPASDPRGMDARRLDLMVQLLTGKLQIIPDTGPDSRSANSPDTGTDSAAAVGRGADSPSADPAGNLASNPDDDPASDPADPDADASSATDQVADQAADADPAHAAEVAGAAGAAGADAGATETGDRIPAGTAPGLVPMAARPARPYPVASTKPLVHVIIPFSTLTGADNSPVELTGYGPLPPASGRQIAADGVWKRLLTDPASGVVLDVGRTRYRPPTALAEYLRARDQHCRMPICRRRALDSQIDHTIAYHAKGGPTDRDNLYDACLCHHRMKDAPGWTVTQHPDGLITWTTPTGHRYSSRPHDYRPEPDLPALVTTLEQAICEQAAAHTSGGDPPPAPRPRGSPFDRPTPPEDPDEPPPF